MAEADCMKASAREDRTVKRALGIVERRLRAVGPLLSDRALVRQWLQLSLTGQDREMFGALFLDKQMRLITWEVLAVGTLSEAAVYPREIIKAALRHGAASLIIAHNHPSGVSEPSLADVSLTERLARALALVDVRLVDHFIIGRGQPYSFTEAQLLPACLPPEKLQTSTKRARTVRTLRTGVGNVGG